MVLTPFLSGPAPGAVVRHADGLRVVLTVQDRASGLTFDISAGTMGGAAGTYVVDCASPAVTPCIERDQELSVSGVASGTYAINVRASRGGTECYTNVDQLPVPPLGRELVRTLNLGSVTPACP